MKFMFKFKRGVTIFSIYISIGLLCSGFFETTAGLNQKGNKSFEGKRYESALEAYRKAQIRTPDNSTIRYNLGTTLYQLDQFQEAETQLEQALAKAPSKEFKANAWYNYGNTQYRLGQFDKATEAYRKALDLNPHDKDAKYNLELLQKKKSIFDIKQDKRDEKREQNQSSSQRQQQQGGGGKQDQKKQESQGQNNQEQQQNQQQDQKNQQAQSGEKGEEKQENQKQEESGQDKSESLASQQENKTDSQPKEGEGQKEKEEPMKLDRFQSGKEGQKPDEGQGTQPKPLLQGQMSQENALRILNALKESEQELQSLRRPRPQTDYEPAKDW